MNKRNTLIFGTLLGLAMGMIGMPVQATSWVDYSPNGGQVEVISNNPDDNTLLRQVTVTCPARGHLIATASGNFILDVSAEIDASIAVASIAVDDPPPTFNDVDSRHYVGAFQIQAGMFESASLQRTQTCSEGQTRSFRFVAWKLYDSTSVRVSNPILVVEFFNTRI